MIGYASYATVIELLAHVANPESPDRPSAWAALRRLWNRCSEYNGSQYVLRFVAGALEQITFALFQVKIDARDGLAGQYGYLVGRLIHAPDALDELRPALEEITRSTDDARSRFTSTLWSNVVQTLMPGAEAWSDLAADSPMKAAILSRVHNGEDLHAIASVVVNQAAAAASLELSPEQQAAYSARVLDLFPTLVHLRSLMIRRLIETGLDMGKRSRANGALDLHVVCATSRVAQLHHYPVLLVTDDRMVLEAAAAASAGDRIFSFATYRELLDRSATEFSRAVGDLQVEIAQ